MKAISASLFFTALVVLVEAGEMPPADAGIDKELPVPSSVIVPSLPPKEEPQMKVKSDYALAQEAYESENLGEIKRICQHPGRRGDLVVYLNDCPPSPWKDEVVLVLLEAPWPGDRTEGKPAPAGSSAQLGSFQLAVDLLSPVLPDVNLKMNDRETYAKLSTLNGRKRLVDKFKQALRKQEPPSNGQNGSGQGEPSSNEQPKNTQAEVAKVSAPPGPNPVVEPSAISPQASKIWIWMLATFVVFVFGPMLKFRRTK